jgi:hypothetical protein
MANYFDCEMDDPDADIHSEGSSIGGLVSSVQFALEQLIGCSETTPNSSYIVEKDVVANVLHAFTELADAMDGIPVDRIPPNPTPSPSKDIQKILERLESIESKSIASSTRATHRRAPSQPGRRSPPTLSLMQPFHVEGP